MNHSEIIQALQESEERYRMIVEQSPFSTVVYEPDGRVRSYNQAAVALWRLDPEQLDNILNEYNLLEDEQHRASGMDVYFRRGFAGEVTSTPPIAYEYPNRGEGGEQMLTTLWAIGHIYPVKDTAGKIREVVVMHEDFTARKLAEEAQAQALRDAEQRAAELATVLESARLASSSLELEEVLFRVARQLTEVTNATACTLSRWDKAQDTVVTWIDYHVPGATIPEPPGVVYRLADYPATRRVLETGLPVLTHIADPAADAAEVALMKRYGIEQVLMLPILHGDVTLGLVELERPQDTGRFTDQEIHLCQTLIAHMAIAIENARLVAITRSQATQMSLILRNVQEGIILLDAENRILLANPNGRRHLRQLTALGDDNVVHALAGQPLDTLLAGELAGGKSYEIILPGRTHIFEITASPLTTDDGAGRTILTVREVTAAREQLRYQQEQERLASVGQLAAGIAHDFNNLLAVISIYSDLIGRTAELSPRNSEKLDTIRRQARRASQLTSQILDFSRRSVMEQSALVPLPFVKEAVNLLERTLPENIEVTFQYEGQLDRIKADPARLQQVLLNLAVNAREAMTEGGALHITLREVVLDRSQAPPVPDMAPGRWLEIALHNTGPVIAPDHLPHLFEPFFTTKEGERGVGLGLAQAHGIVHQHGGHIAVRSEVGKGTTFRIFLPFIVSNEAPSVAPPEAAAAKGEGETILIVEDDAVTLEAVSEALEATGYKTLTASDGLAGLQLYRERADEIALIVSDLVMPRMGGAALLESLRRINAPVKMIVITGYPLDDAGKRLLEEGVVAWLSKPFSTHQLTAAVHDALHSQADIKG